MEPNPKSVLRGKTPFSLDRTQVAPNDHNSLRVTFAKAPLNNPSGGSSSVSVNPSLYGSRTGTPAKPISRPPFHTAVNPNTKSYLTRNGVGNDPKAKPNTTMVHNRPNLATATRANAKHTENYTPKGSPAAGQGPSSSKRSNTTINTTATADEDKKAEDVSIQAQTSKSKRRFKKFLRRSSKSFSGLHRTKSGKKLKKKKSTIQDEDKLETEEFKPAPMDAEYASELGKITQILKAVTAFEASTSTPNATIPRTSSPRIKITSMVEGNKSGHWGSGTSIAHNSIHRPLSAEELKQLLSSITRVVSLHQLPGNDQKEGSISPNSSSTVKDSGSLSKVSKSKKKIKKKKLPNYMSGTANREAVKTKSVILSTRSTRSKPSRRGKKSKNEHRKRDASDGSSVSSLDKDPAKNAAFLKKYFEESTRLAEKKSSDELMVKGEGIQGVKEAPSNTSNLKNKKGGKNSTTIPNRFVKGNTTTSNPKASVKNLSKASVSNIDAKKKSLASTTSLKPTMVQRVASKMRRATDSVEKIKKPPAQNTTPPNVKVESNAQEKGKPQADTKGKSTASKLSTTAVAGSPKANSPVSSQLNAAINALRDRDQGPSKPKTPIIDPSNNAALRQQQFKSIEEVINSKFTGDTAKMKSIWEKTPYQPMTHSRFRDMVSRYASPEANAAYAKADEASRLLNASAKVPKTVPAETTPANLLTLPTQWAIKEKLAEETNNEKTVTLLQGPPATWQADTSMVTTAYNRTGYSKGNMQNEARQIRRRFNDGDNDRSRPTTTKDEYLGGVGGGPGKNINEALNYYKNLFKRNAISK